MQDESWGKVEVEKGGLEESTQLCPRYEPVEHLTMRTLGCFSSNAGLELRLFLF